MLNITHLTNYRDLLEATRKNHIPTTITNQLLSQLFYYMDAQAFNECLKKPQVQAGTGFQIKMALSRVESALNKADKALSVIRYLIEIF